MKQNRLKLQSKVYISNFCEVINHNIQGQICVLGPTTMTGVVESKMEDMTFSIKL